MGEPWVPPLQNARDTAAVLAAHSTASTTNASAPRSRASAMPTSGVTTRIVRAAAASIGVLGRAVYDAALKNPDSLASHLKGEADVEAECDPAFDAYETATGKADYADALLAKYPKLRPMPDLDDGWDFDDDAEMRRRYPKLFADYGGADE